MLKTVELHSIFVETDKCYFSLFVDEHKEQHLSEIEVF